MHKNLLMNEISFSLKLTVIIILLRYFIKLIDKKCIFINTIVFFGTFNGLVL